MSYNGKSIDRLAEHVRALPRADQVVLLRKIAPTIVAEADDAERDALVSEINRAILMHVQAARAR